MGYFRKKSDNRITRDILRRVIRFYGKHDRDDIYPDIEIGEDDLEQAWELYALLEAVEWKWTIADIQAQPARLLKAVLAVKNIADQYRTSGDNPTGSI